MSKETNLSGPEVSSAYLLYFRITLLFFVIQSLIRTILTFKTTQTAAALLGIFTRGFLWDFNAWAFLGLPILLLIVIIPKRFERLFLGSKLSQFFTFLFVLALSFVGFCELTFWDEFHSRFNFIAVDYLIYTNEVIANINESFPMPLIMSGLIIFSGILVFTIYQITLIPKRSPKFITKPLVLVIAFLFPVLTGLVMSPLLNESEQNFRFDQLGRNGWIEFYRAFRSNSIDYQNFYATISSVKAKSFVDSKKELPTSAYVKLDSRPNVVMIVVESLGAKFIAPLGGQATTTPYLNKLSEKSIFFENLYASGTRTVRGLEAINLSIPPTPGYAVVKRPDHKNLYSLGHTFKTNGYEPIFLYGGRGFFDNMNSFFEGNGFRSVDQTDFSKSEVTFSNAWGVCDEDLFKKALSIMDKKESNLPKLLFMLTTSNHRPFTYPNGKIDIPSGESRAGAVKYTDYAIGKFIDESLKRDWAKNTIFVIVADHSTEGRGRFDLEMADYHIPMWIFSPHMLPPTKINKLVAQIDILPSLIHLLGLKDNSPFFGRSFFANTNDEERAFIGNYQYVGFYKNKILTTLGPNRNIRSYSYDPLTKEQKDISESPFSDEAISYFQYASELLKTGRYSVSKPVISLK